MDRAHLPILATILGNDYIDSLHFKSFYDDLAQGRKYVRMRYRHRIIKNVISWLANQKGRKPKDVIKSVSIYNSV